MITETLSKIPELDRPPFRKVGEGQSIVDRMKHELSTVTAEAKSFLQLYNLEECKGNKEISRDFLKRILAQFGFESSRKKKLDENLKRIRTLQSQISSLLSVVTLNITSDSRKKE